MTIPQATFARQWFDEWKADPAVYGPATQRLVELIEQEPEAAWLHILTLVREAPDEAHRSSVGAGPLEDLLCHHGSLFIDRIETAAAADDQLRKCLGYVWGETRMAPSLRCFGLRLLHRWCRLFPHDYMPVVHRLGDARKVSSGLRPRR